MALPTTFIRRERFWAWSIVLLGLLAHGWWQQWLVSFVLAPVFIPLTLAWLLRRPGPVLISLGVAFELLASTPPGVVIAACLVPLLAKRIGWRIEPDTSFRFIALIALTALIQITLLVLPQVLQEGSIPLRIVWLPWLVSSAAAFLVISWYYYSLPGTIGYDLSATRPSYAP
mgnify:CR=1 FL=1